VGTLLGSIEVIPLYAQVVVESEGASDLPVPETGEERAVASTQCVLIATRGDRDGSVTIDVWREHDGRSAGEVVFDGELSLLTPRLVVGSPIADALLGVDLRRSGQIPITVSVDPLEAPSRVTVSVRD